MAALKFLPFLLAIVCVYLVFSPLLGMPIYSQVLFHPYKFPSGHYQSDSINGIKAKEVFFAGANGKKLHGWYFRSPQAKVVVLVSHGNGGNLTHRLDLAKVLLDAGTSVFAYDYQGYGRSEGTPSIKGICEDGKAAYHYLTQNEQILPQQLILYGESLGTGVTCSLAGSLPCGGIILQSGYSSLRRAGMQKLPILQMYPLWLFPEPELDNLAVIKRPHPPLLILHGQKDSLLPVSHSEELYREAVEPKVFASFPEASHNDVLFQKEFVDALRNFLGQAVNDSS